jgi:hypothetical protein
MVKSTVFALMASVLVAGLAIGTPASAMKHESGGHAMSMHHQHMLLDHGLSMVLEGSNLVMLGKMEMVSSLDPLTVEHGKKMVANGKALIEKTLSGSEMMAMHKAGKSPKDDPGMKATHELGESVLKMVDLIEKMDAGGMGGHMMAMHHQHILINHALNMALEGADLAMLGGMKMAPSLDPMTVEHGKKMVANGKALIGKVMDGAAMKDMHAKGIDPEKDPMMKSTHQMVEVAYKIIGQLEKMLEGN